MASRLRISHCIWQREKGHPQCIKSQKKAGWPGRHRTATSSAGRPFSRGQGHPQCKESKDKKREGREGKGRTKNRGQYVHASKEAGSEMRAPAHGAERSWRICSLAQPAVLGPNSMARGRPAAEIWDGIAAVSRNETQCASAELRELKPSSPSSSNRKHWPSSRETAAV